MYLPKDPLRRFIDIFEVLHLERGWFADTSSLRFAAMAAITCEGAPASVARALRAIADELKERSGWFGELTGSLRFIVAAMLLQNDDRPADFMAEVDRVRNMFREAGVRRGGSYEVMAALILRGPHKSPVVEQTVARFQAIYEEMKTHHWWITGVADFPACAILVGQPGTPESLGQEIEAIYQELHAVGFKKGDPLQTSANLLYLAHEKPSVVAARFLALAETFRSASQRIWQSEYDELAILSLLKQPAVHVVEQVQQIQEALRTLRPRPDRSLAFNLASSIAFLQLVQPAEQTAGITDAKALLDMQAILNAQQAAVMAASMAAITAASASSHAASS
jgi:hypothetical protein